MKETVQKALKILTRNEKRQFAIFIALDVLISIIDVFSIAVLLWIVKLYVDPQTRQHFPFLPHGLFHPGSVAFIALYFLLFSTKNIAAFLITRSHHNFIGKIAVRLSEDNLKYYQSIDFEEFTKVDSSVFIRKIAYEPFEFCQYVLLGIEQITTQLSLVAITIIAILLFNAKLFLLVIAILVPPVLVVFYFIKKRLSKDKLKIKSSNQKSLQYLLDALKGYVEANIYNRNNFFLERFIRYRKKFSYYLFDSLSVQTAPNRIIEIVAVLGLFVLILIGNGKNTGSFLLIIGAFVAAAYKIIPGMVRIINVGAQMKAYEFGAFDLAVAESRDEVPAEKNIHSVEFKNVSFAFNGTAVLQNFSSRIERGDFVGITGPSGCGKTTLFNLLLGFLMPCEGEILINGLVMSNTTIRSFWPRIGYVRQQSFFIHDTIAKNISFSENGYEKERLQLASAISGLDAFFESSAAGPEKIITENAKNISGGQQQRISLARAVYKNADLILLDEPFNELDAESELKLLQHFKAIASSGKIVVMISHNQKSLGHCNKIISLNGW